MHNTPTQYYREDCDVIKSMASGYSLQEVRVFDKDGNLKEVISQKTVQEQHQFGYAEVPVRIGTKHLMTKKCKRCQNEFKTKDVLKRFCSVDICAKAHKAKLQKIRRGVVVRKDIPCDWCKKPFTPRNKKGKYCQRNEKECQKNGQYRSIKIRSEGLRKLKALKMSRMSAGL